MNKALLARRCYVEVPIEGFVLVELNPCCALHCPLPIANVLDTYFVGKRLMRHLSLVCVHKYQVQMHFGMCSALSLRRWLACMCLTSLPSDEMCPCQDHTQFTGECMNMWLLCTVT